MANSIAKSCAVIGYPSGQDGAILSVRRNTHCVPQKQFLRRRYSALITLVIKFIRSRWLDSARSFLLVYGPSRSNKHG